MCKAGMIASVVRGLKIAAFSIIIPISVHLALILSHIPDFFQIESPCFDSDDYAETATIDISPIIVVVAVNK